MTRLMGALAVMAVLVLAGCGSSNSNSSGSGASGGSSGSSGSSTSSSSSGGGETLTIAADPNGSLAFDKKSLTASKAGTVTIDFTNKSSTPHAIAVEGNGVSKIGQTITGGNNSITVTLKKGTYTFYCPVDGHRAAGMEGKLTVG